MTKQKWLFGGASVGLLLIVFIVGVIFTGGFNMALAWTNTESFCISCHEMQTNYNEYKKTIHNSNRTGVRATCPDCHVPHEFGPKMMAKLHAAKDVWHHITGLIDTKEKYENYRLTMAKDVWEKMKATDSRECRNCHKVESMAFDEQQGRAARKHKSIKETGKTCIDCHKGVAHELPQDYDEAEEEDDS